MNTELLTTIAAIFSIFEALAVVASLLFINVQLREARRVSSGNAYQSWLDSMNSFFSSLSASEDLGLIYWKGRAELTKLNKKEYSRFFYLCVQWFTLMENLHIQYQQKLIPDEFFHPWQNTIRADINNHRGLLQYWQLEGELYSPQFRSFVDSLITMNVTKK